MYERIGWRKMGLKEIERFAKRMPSDETATAKPIFKNAVDLFRACPDFRAIHRLVKRLVRGIKGLGPLYCYDVALRIGARFGRLPREVYLHTGAEKGAKVLGLDTSKGFLEMSEVPAAFQDREPWEVEDILCLVFKLSKKGYRFVD
jgi:hypothetical protein